jgi:pimeloyl-ACP methyl ester carboxylesterase
MTPVVRRARLLVALSAVVITAASCGASPIAKGPSGTNGGVTTTTAVTTTTTAVTTTTTAVTTTTLALTTGIPETVPVGSLGVLGSIQRARVTPPQLGALAAASTASGVPLPPSEKIAFRRFGAGPDLLLIAGEHSTITSWDPEFLSNLAGHFRVTVFDPPGIGYSGPGLATASIRSFADAAAGLSNALGLITPIVIGWGLGGGVALSIAERHPGLVSGLVLINSTVGAPNEVVSASAAAILRSPDVTPTILSHLYFPPSAEAARLAWLATTSGVPADSLVASAVAEEGAVQARATADLPLISGLGAITPPVLVMSASANPLTSPGYGRTIANELAHATYVLIPNGGYACFSVAGPEVINSISSFVSSTLSG